jgi:uracil-DNA glycosylase
MSELDLRSELQLLAELGFSHLDLEGARARSGSTPSDALLASSDGGAVRHTPSGEPGTAGGCGTIDEIGQMVTACTKCRLAETRTNVVIGTGNPDAELMFVGEAPGRDEDLAGIPFVGRAGQLLTDIIKAMGFARDQVYIANVIKCRPPENRNPEADEIEQCRPFLERQIELVNPRVIVTLGRFAFQSMIDADMAISAARGNWFQLGSVKVMPTYHPAYLLRNPSAKKEVWSDMKKVMAELEG